MLKLWEKLEVPLGNIPWIDSWSWWVQSKTSVDVSEALTLKDTHVLTSTGIKIPKKAILKFENFVFISPKWLSLQRPPSAWKKLWWSKIISISDTSFDEQEDTPLVWVYHWDHWVVQYFYNAKGSRLIASCYGGYIPVVIQWKYNPYIDLFVCAPWDTVNQKIQNIWLVNGTRIDWKMKNQSSAVLRSDHHVTEDWHPSVIINEWGFSEKALLSKMWLPPLIMIEDGHLKNINWV